MSTDLYSLCVMRERFTLREAAALWAGFPALTRDNAAQCALRYRALVEAAQSGKLVLEQRVLLPPAVRNWVIDWGQSNAPAPSARSASVDWASSTVTTVELRRWFADIGQTPAFLFGGALARSEPVRPAPASKLGAPAHNRQIIKQLLSVRPRLDRKTICRQYQEMTGRALSPRSLTQIKKELRE